MRGAVSINILNRLICSIMILLKAEVTNSVTLCTNEQNRGGVLQKIYKMHNIKLEKT